MNLMNATTAQRISAVFVETVDICDLYQGEPVQSFHHYSARLRLASLLPRVLSLLRFKALQTLPSRSYPPLGTTLSKRISDLPSQVIPCFLIIRS